MLESLLLALIMFNLLIAIISQTFVDFSENRERVDIQQKVEIMYEYSIQRLALKAGFCKKSKDIEKILNIEKNMSLHILTEKKQETNDFEDLTNQISRKFILLTI